MNSKQRQAVLNLYQACIELDIELDMHPDTICNKPGFPFKDNWKDIIDAVIQWKEYLENN